MTEEEGYKIVEMTDLDPDYLYGDGQSTLPTAPSKDGSFVGMVPPDEICQACGEPLANHAINVLTNMGDAIIAQGGGLAHKLCAVEEVEVRVK